jgi:hypothetical protein
METRFCGPEIEFVRHLPRALILHFAEAHDLEKSSLRLSSDFRSASPTSRAHEISYMPV